MPRDQWAIDKATDIAKRGLREEQPRNRRNRQQKKQKPVAGVRSTFTTSRLQSPRTKLWFGKYNGQSIEEINRIDPPYIQWLKGLKTESWRIQAVIDFLNSP